jgi:hypothetical protein
MERFIIKENSWKSMIWDFQQKKINHQEREAQREVADLQAMMLREQHIRHLSFGSFNFDQHLLMITNIAFTYWMRTRNKLGLSCAKLSSSWG